MTDNRCFIQLHHFGGEHGTDSGKGWNTYEHNHMRKFMQLDGEWIDESGNSGSGKLWSWVEWEAQSRRLRDFDRAAKDGLPRHLWYPHYEPMPDHLQLHNTDPFVFGERFLYSNCGQRRGQRGPGKTLKLLDCGSLIVFGSCVSHEWVLDTVFVVAASIDYRAGSMRRDVAHRVPNEFMDVTGEPIVRNEDPELALRLYFGATPEEPIGGMFSFFPAMPAEGAAGFPRPHIDLPGAYFNPTKCQAHKQTCGLTPAELRGLWDSLVAQVREAGLVLGTYAELPERREA